jgi:hypothetical protein
MLATARWTASLQRSMRAGVATARGGAWYPATVRDLLARSKASGLCHAR